MDMHSAELQVEKLLKYVQDIEARQPTLYKKSKDRLRDISSNCIRVVEVISEILKEESLIQDREEFEGSNNSDVVAFIEGMEEEVNKMKEFVGYSSSRSKYSTISDRRSVFSTYKNSLKKLSESNISYHIVNDCSKLIWRWFDTRFDSKRFPSFRYNLSNMPMWLERTVIYLGGKIATGTFNEAVDEYEDWFIKLDQSENFYVVPYSVNKLCKKITPFDITLTAVVLWDILIDNGLVLAGKRLNKDSRDKFCYVDDARIYDMCADQFPSILDNYRDYKDDPSILVECKLSEVV